MKARPNDGTTGDLELFHDEELDSGQREELSEALREDPTLRDRLATVYRVDDAIRAALGAEEPNRQAYCVTWRRPSLIGLAAATIIISVIPAVVWYAVSQSSSRRTRLAACTPHEPLPAPAALDYEPIRVVLSLPVPRSATDPRGATPRSGGVSLASSRIDNRTLIARVDQTLRAGRLQETLRLLEASTEDQRVAAYRYMGELLRSASAAEQILDLLAPSEQLAVCGEWAREPRLRPVAFTRLRLLSGDPEVVDALRRLTTALANEPDLRLWLRSYRLVAPSAAWRSAPS
ncbi:MAG: hypothetical protein PVI86_07885 [Phycisphaerae bacterium]|jgi:hypothetical protein